MGKHRPPRKPTSKAKNHATSYAGVKKHFSSKNGHKTSRKSKQNGKGESNGHRKEEIPFGKEDRILLIGEGTLWVCF